MSQGYYFLIVVLISVCAPFMCAADGLVAYWPFDGSAVDASSNGHDGTLMNGPVWSSEGDLGGCLSFDGVDDYVTVASYKGISGGTSRTCMAWIKTSAVSGEIVTWGNSDSGAKWIVRVNETGTLRAEVEGGYIYGTTAIDDGAWHHIAVVLDDDGTPDIEEVLLYVDGQLEVTAASLDEPINTAADQDVTIGVYTLVGTRYFEGLIDDVRIYETSLGVTDIWSLYPGLDPGFDGGEGTVDDPFEISTALQLISIGSNPSLLAKHYILTDDIDLSGHLFTDAVIAFDERFFGSFNGDGQTIRNLRIQTSENAPLGLFGFIEEGASVSNLILEDVFIEGTSGIGALCGLNWGTISNCHVTGEMIGTSTVGGICGRNDNWGVISHCSATVQLTVSTRWGGGICGQNAPGTITQCYAAGEITGNARYLGGICGLNELDSEIADCYCTVNVTGYSEIGGFCGENISSIARCYSAGTVSGDHYIGGFCGFNASEEIMGCFWDTDISEMTMGIGYDDTDDSSIDLTGLSTATMQKRDTFLFSGWDLVGESMNGEEEIWRICREGQTSPQLSWELSDTGDCEAIVPIGGYGGGSGTEGDPYLISEPIHLYEMYAKTDPNPYYYSEPVFYLQTSDIEMTGLKMKTIPMLIGIYEGDDHTIHNLAIHEIPPADWYGPSSTGLFESVGRDNGPYSAVRNLHLENVQITGGRMVGSLAAKVVGTIINCSSSGSVHAAGAEISQDAWVGGLAGLVYLTGNIEKCFSSCSVSAESLWGGSYAGGLVGENQMATIINCYADGSVSAIYAGGLLGSMIGGRVSNCYSTSVIDESSWQGAGLIGSFYDYFGQYTIANCYWDTEISGVTEGIPGLPDDPNVVAGLATVQMKQQNSFKAWDFVAEGDNGDNEIWRMCVDGVDTPRLSWEFARWGDFACGDGVDLGDLQALAEHWLLVGTAHPTEFNHACDANGDEVIDMADFGVLSENWP